MIVTYLGTVLVSFALGAGLFYGVGYRKGYSNARHHIYCGVHMDEDCDCLESA